MKTKLFKIIFFLIIINTLFVSSAFALSVQPSSLDFGSYETGLTVTLTSTLGSTYLWVGYGDIKWGVDSKPSWVSVSPKGGYFPCSGGSLQPKNVTVSVNRTGLTPGQTYSGTVRFYDRDLVYFGDMTFANLSVSMRVPLPAQLSVSPDSYNFGETGTSCQFSVQNTGEITLNWSASEGLSWLSLSSSGGNLGQGALQFVTATVNRGGLAPGTYTGTISFTSNGGDKDVPVSMTVPEPDPELLVGPTSHDFGTSETSCQFAVTNTGGGTLNWSVSEGISWLNLSLSGGSVGPGASQFVTATVNRGGLAPGTYTGTISLPAVMAIRMFQYL